MTTRPKPTAVVTAALLDEFKQGFPRAHADVVARWGSAHVVDLVVALAASSRWGDETWSLGSIESVDVVTAGPLSWINYHQSHTGMNWYHAVHGPSGFVSCKGAQALELMLAEFMPDVVEDAPHIMRAYETISYANVLYTADDIAAQRVAPFGFLGDDDDDAGFDEPTWNDAVGEQESPAEPPATVDIDVLSSWMQGAPPSPRREGPRDRASADVVRLLEPPHLHGRQFVFCAHQYWDGIIDRITIDIETYAVEVVKIGDARKEMMPMGRAYVADDGAVSAAFPLATSPARPVHAGQATWAALWRAAAQGEHASVASFARASMELMAIGAPLELVERTHAAAMDEIRHTRFACEQAAVHDGQALMLGPLPALPARPATIASVLQTTLEEAAIPETYNAIAARVAADECRNNALRDALGAVADDEDRHANLAFDVVAWCLTQRPELVSVVTSAPLDPPRLDIVPVSGHGFLDAAGREEVIRRGREHLARRIRSLR